MQQFWTSLIYKCLDKRYSYSRIRLNKAIHLVTFLMIRFIYQNMIQSLFSYQFLQELTQIRRHIHKNPQIGLEEYQTSKLVRKYLKSIEGIQLLEPFESIPTAVIAKIKVLNSKNTFLFRCQLDALPWKQMSGQQFSSVNSCHHACGHDAHTASMLVAAKILANKKQQLKNSIVFCFQPGEEGKGGAFKLFQACKNTFQKEVTYCFAIHFGNHKPVGYALASEGYVTANSNRFDIQILGRGCHVMIPQKGIDANFIGCGLVSEIYSLKQRRLSPLQRGVICVTKVQGGQSLASISQKFRISGTMRLFSQKSAQIVKSQIKNISQKYCQMHQAKATVTFTGNFYRAVFNDKKPTDIVKKTLAKILKPEFIQDQEPSFAGQDFCQFSQRFPSCYMTLGSAIDDSFDQTGQSKYPLHSNRHRLNEKAMVLAVQIWCELALFQS